MSDEVTPADQPAKSEQQAEKPDNKEMRYRLERNEVRQERDDLAQRIEQLQVRECERIASRDLSVPADLFTLGGVTVKDLQNEHGDIDPEKVALVVTEVLGTRPGLKVLDRAVDSTQGLGGTPPKPTPSWGGLFG